MPFDRMRSAFALSGLALLISGCAHGPGGASRSKDAVALASENADLRTERKMLQQELANARKESDALRAAIDAHAAPSTSEIAIRLDDARRELATLRANYASLQSERDRLQALSGRSETEATITALEQVSQLKTKLADAEDKLAASLRNYTQLQDQDANLRRQVATLRSENDQLAKEAQDAGATNERNQAALERLTADLAAEKDARARAEQIALSLRNQLKIVTAQDTPAASAQATAPAASTEAPKPADAAAPPATPRTYVVQAGDTLESIAQRLYGASERWTTIYAANEALLGGDRALKAGTTLTIPAQ